MSEPENEKTEFEGLRVIKHGNEKCQASMLEVLDEIRALVASGECEGLVISACIGGRPANEREYSVLHRIPGLMPCEVVYLMREVEMLALTTPIDD